MSNDGNNAAEKWLAGDLTSALEKAVRPKCQADNANITLYVDLRTNLRANYFPTSLNTYEHPRTQHNQSCTIS